MMGNCLNNRIQMAFLAFKKRKNVEKKNIFKKEESRIVKLDLVGIFKSDRGYYLIFEIKKDDVLSTAKVSIRNFKEYIKSLLSTCYPGSAEELACKMIKKYLKHVTPKGSTNEMFESVQKISQILKRDSAIKELIYKGPMLNQLRKKVEDAEKAAEGCVLFKISNILYYKKLLK